MNDTDLILEARRQWLVAARKRTGKVTVLPNPGREWAPPHTIDPQGYGVEFCEVPETSRFASPWGEYK